MSINSRRSQLQEVQPELISGLYRAAINPKGGGSAVSSAWDGFLLEAPQLVVPNH